MGGRSSYLFRLVEDGLTRSLAERAAVLGLGDVFTIRRKASSNGMGSRPCAPVVFGLCPLAAFGLRGIRLLTHEIAYDFD